MEATARTARGPTTLVSTAGMSDAFVRRMPYPARANTRTKASVASATPTRRGNGGLFVRSLTPGSPPALKPSRLKSPPAQYEEAVIYITCRPGAQS